VNVSPKTTAILLGTAIGATLGATAGWAYMRQLEARNASNAVAIGLPAKMNAGAGDFIKLGIALLALVRQVDDLFRP
jgi:hypothetical protein